MVYSVRLVLRKDTTDSDGRHAVRICVTKNKTRRYFSLDIFVDTSYWDDVNECLIVLKGCKGDEQRNANKKRIEQNAILERYKVKARSIINRYELDGVDWTVNQFADAFVGGAKMRNIKPYLSEHIKKLKETNHIGNAKCYEETLRMLMHYDKRFDSRVFAEIDLRYVNGFDEYLQKRGCKGNTRRYYMKALRAILKRAINEGIGNESTYPFGSRGFEVAKLGEVTAKRYLSEKYLQIIKETISQKPQNEYARLLFLFSYYCYGISFVDMAMLRHSNVITLQDGDYIIYKRQKIKNQKNVVPISIFITDSIRAIIDSLCSESTTVDDYLLPIITCSGYSGERLYNHVRGRYKKYRSYLRSLAVDLCISDFHLTSYVNRHTMAMTLQQNRIPREIISQMLGHSDLEMTNTYLDSFDHKTINEAAKVL